MFTFFFIPTILILVAISLVLRLVIRPVLNAYRIRRPYEYNGYGRDYRRHRFGGLLSILALVALDRIVGRRW